MRIAASAIRFSPRCAEVAVDALFVASAIRFDRFNPCGATMAVADPGVAGGIRTMASAIRFSPCRTRVEVDESGAADALLGAFSIARCLPRVIMPAPADVLGQGGSGAVRDLDTSWLCPPSSPLGAGRASRAG